MFQNQLIENPKYRFTGFSKFILITDISDIGVTSTAQVVKS